MLLLAALLATAAWSCGFAQEIPIQSPISVTKFRKNARMICEIQALGEGFGGSIIHWYQQKEGKAPERLLFFSGGRTVVDTGFQANSNGIAREHASLLQRQNMVWSAWIKYFGTGTKLIVSNKGSSAPVKSEILEKKHENLITYVCLIEKFYPEVIRVTWTDGEKEITDNVGKGAAWKPAEQEEYSIGSWLTVPAENKNKNYYCKYEHESQQRSLSTKDSTQTSQTSQEDCSTYTGNSTVFNRDHLMHRAAYLVYIVLLLKSFMYYLIILFFIYRMWASTKHQGKKA